MRRKSKLLQQAQAYFWGKVVHGDTRGKALGYPTANVRLHRRLAEGVYVARVRIDRRWHNALTFIGAAKTFNRSQYQSETHILDFSGNLYGQYISVQLLRRLRGNKKFNSIQALIHAMQNDELAARTFFKNK